MESSESSRQAGDTSPTGAASAGGRRSTLREVLWPSIAWAIGLLIMAWPTFSTGFAKVQGGLGDSRLVNFSLEHSYRWLMGMPLAEDLWSPPIFYPVRNVATYTDLMLGAAPFYWPWRWLGMGSHTAYQIWMLACWSLNFLCCYLLLRHGLRVRAVAASAGAYLFAFASPRWMSMAHQQLVPQFWLILSLAGLIMIFGPATRPLPSRRWLASLAFFGGLVAQLYTAFYPLAFFALGVGAAAVFALASSTTRRTAVGALRRHLVPLLVVGFVAIAVAAPITLRYRATAELVGLHRRHNVRLPKPLSWFLPGSSNRVYGAIQRSWNLADYRGYSQTNGVGLVTLVLCLGGLWIGRRRPVVRLVFAGFAGLVLLTLTLPGGWSPWWVVREVVPGSAALRAVARVGLMALYPAAIGLAIAIDELLAGRRGIVAAALLVIVAAEQPHRRPSFDKAVAIHRVQAIASEVPAGAGSFLLVVDGSSWDKYLHDDAAWAALAAGVPTVNGRYGHFPPGYPFRTPRVENPEDGEAIRNALAVWLSSGGADPKASAVIRVEPRPHRKRSRKK